MKKIFIIIGMTIISLNIFTQSPQKMSYQCVVRNSSGALITNHAVGMKISILQGSATGIVVYSENYSPAPQSNANGLVTVEIGSGSPITGAFTGINWEAGPYFLKTETDPAGGTNYTITGTTQLLSVPYALYAKTAGNGFSGNYYDLNNKPILFTGNYNDLINKPILFDGIWTNVTGKPTTLAGFGITDGMSTSHAANEITSNMIANLNTAYGWGNHTGLYKSNTYVPNWVEITDKPTFPEVATSGLFSDLLSKPTTLSGYGITDAMSTSHPANGVTSVNILNWNTAYSWGNHSGLYRPIEYVPFWSEITSKPTSVAGYGITDAVITVGDQTIAGNKTFTGTIKGTIDADSTAVSNVANPIANQDAATKAYVDALGKKIELLTGKIAFLAKESNSYATSDSTGIVVDFEGNLYKSVKIGNQWWMAENLKTTKYNDNTPIPLVTDDTEWSNLINQESDGYCWYNNDITNKDTYGALYNQNVKGKECCPVGWHYANFYDWFELIITIDPYANLGMGPITEIAGGLLKEVGTTHWLSPNVGATNDFGFTALPGGYRDGQFSGIGLVGIWSIFSISNGSTTIHIDNDIPWWGFSIRCVKD